MESIIRAGVVRRFPSISCHITPRIPMFGIRMISGRISTFTCSFNTPGKENADYLYSLAEHFPSSPEDHVYTVYEWLKAVYEKISPNPLIHCVPRKQGRK